MIIIQKKWFPFKKGFSYITIWPFLFCKESPTPIVVNHEKIHERQVFELLWIGFYFISIFEYIKYGSEKGSLEREAYENEANLNYLKSRRWFAMWRK